MARKVGLKAGTESEPKLSEEQQIYVVSCLASFKTLDWIVKDVAERFGVSLTKQAVWYYSPANPGCPERWKNLFDEVRTDREKNIARIASANLWYRTEMLDEMLHDAKERGNKVLAAALARQIAEDTGGVYTKTREFTGPGGTPLMSGAVSISAVDLMASLRCEPAAAAQSGPIVPEDPEPPEQ